MFYFQSIDFNQNKLFYEQSFIKTFYLCALATNSAKIRDIISRGMWEDGGRGKKLVGGIEV